MIADLLISSFDQKKQISFAHSALSYSFIFEKKYLIWYDKL